MKELLPHIKLDHSPSRREPDASVIWLHGLGADGHDFEPVVPQLGLAEDLAVRFIFPHAPVRPVTINQGWEMRSWYDILAMDEIRKIDERQLQQSCDQLEAFIEYELDQGIASNRIIVAGFSQGGAVALSTALRYQKPLGGIMALSTYLPIAEWIEQGRAAANADVAIFMAHGIQDPVVPYSLACSSRSKLETFGYRPDWREYPMPHSVCPQEIDDISQWLARRLTIIEETDA